jgi:hypothetical protein
VHEYPLSRLMQNVLNQARSSVSSGTIAMAPRHTEWV